MWNPLPPVTAARSALADRGFFVDGLQAPVLSGVPGLDLYLGACSTQDSFLNT